MAEGLIKRLNTEIAKLKESEKDKEKAVASRRQLEAQLQENNLVKDELDLLEPDASKVYKLVGPVLVRQDLSESKQTVAKRIEYINTEIRRQEAILKDIDVKQTTARDAALKIQQQLQQAQVKMAMKS